MATVPHVTAWAGRTKYQADGFLFDGVYKKKFLICRKPIHDSSVDQPLA